MTVRVRVRMRIREFDLQEIEAATESFSAARLIGKGSHGSVYSGILADGTLVAVKKQSSALLKLPDSSKLQNEGRILSSVPPASRRLILNLFGVARGVSGDTILVAEYLPNGTLHDLLHCSPTPPTWRNRLKYALQLARAVCFLHAPDVSVAHRDIKPSNILLDGHWNLKLADFGLATPLNAVDVLPAGTIGYIDPDYTTASMLSREVDVYSYGVVLLELISGRKAIDVAKSPTSVVEWALPLIKQRRTMKVCDARVGVPPHMEGTIEVMLRTAARCLSPTVGLRPSMREIVAELEDLTAPEIRVLPPSINCIPDFVYNSMTMRRPKF